MSTVGQGVGGLVGGIAGFFIGGPSGAIYGAQIGIMAGGYIDPPKGPKGKRPSASDLAVQTATYGAPLGDGDGSYATLGNIFWVKGNRLEAVERELSGGKGGGGSAGTTYDIYGTFAVGFGEGKIEGYGKIWFGSQLVMDATSGSLGTIIASNENGGRITLYRGTMTQLPDPDIQADMGAANTPAYRGLHYIVVKNWPMADFGNTLMGLQVKAEIINGPKTAADALVSTVIVPPNDGRIYSLHRLKNDRIVSTSLTWLAWNYDLLSVHQQQYVFGAGANVGLSDAAIPLHHDGAFEGKTPLYSQQSDVDCVLCALYRNTPTYIIAYDASGTRVMDSGPVPAATLPYLGYRCVVDRGDVFLMDNGAKLYKLPLAVAASVATVEASAGTWSVEMFGASKNYLFAVLYSSFSPTSCTVYKIDRVTLTLAATYTQAISGSYAVIKVIGDDEFYTMASNGYIYRWLGGVASDTGLRYTGGHAVDNRLLVVSPSLVYVIKDGNPSYIYACWLAASRKLVPLADIIERRCLKSGLLTAGDLDTSEITQQVRGYKVSSIGPIRAALEPLQAAWPFDVIPHGYQIKFAPRGKTPVATIDVLELGCVEGGQQPGVQITASREMDSQLPRKVLVSYLDVNREYDLNTGPGAERLNTDAVNVLQLELPIVMNADEAAQAEEVLLYMYWLERHDVKFVLPPTHGNLEAADVVTITAPGASYELRLTAINYLPDGRLECTAKFNDVAVYTSVAVGQKGQSTGQVLSFAGPSNLVLLDVPVMNDAMNAPGILVGMGGYLDGWPGGTLYRSSDAGQTWGAIQGFPQGMVSGVAVNAIGDGRTDIVDALNRLNIRLHAGDLYSVSLTAMLNGANWFAYGTDGRWEIIAAQNVTAESDGSLTLTDLLRGRFGTEWAMTLHSTYDEIVLLDTSALKFVDMNTSDIGLSKVYRAVTSGRTFDTASDETQAYRGVNFKPLAPVYLKGSRHPTTNGWNFEWIRRTRIGGEWRDGMDAMLGETSEAWDVEIWDATYTTRKRTLSGLTAAAGSYSSVDQLTDFGSIQSALYLKIYQLSATVGRGYPLMASISTTMPVYNNPPTAVEYLVVAGGGSGGFSSTGNSYAGGGGGGGGVLQGSGHAVTAGVSYTVTVGAGGTGTNSSTQNGSNSVFNTLTATGGGAGGRGALTAGNGNNGGCGGGSSDGGTAGTGTGGQGYAGGAGATTWGTAGGGGGAGAVGANDAAGVTGNGGAGVSSAISGTSLNYGGGGGAGRYYNTDTGGGGTHGGGSGGTGNTGGGSRSAGTAGAATTGGGGGGAGAGNTGTAQAGGNGGSGTVIIRYPDTYGPAVLTTGSPSIVVAGGYRTYTWTSSGTITF